MKELSRNRGQGILMILRIIIEAASAFFVTAALLHYGTTSTAIGSELIAAQPEIALLGLSLSVITIWLIITLFFGRIYCSTLCPLGAVMDLASRTRKRERVYRYKKPLTALRLIILAIVFLLIVSRLAFARRWLLPFGLYESMLERITQPQVIGATLISALIFALIAITAFLRGRLFCNTLCPMGTLLGMLSRRSLFHMDINTDRCTQCRRCVDVCKAQCIDLQDHVIDMSRCVVCFDCLPQCPDDAITYTLGRHTLSDPLMMPKLDMNENETIS